MKKKKAAKIAARRVEAWLYTVINPLIEALKIEKSFVKDKNWTWRYDTKRLEFILHLEEYIDSASQPNFEDFFTANPKIEQKRKKHEELRTALSEHCQIAFGHLIGLEDFQSKVKSSLSKYHDYPGGAVPEEDFHKLIAQYVVNGIKSLPTNYTTSDFWQKMGGDFLVFRTGEIFQKLNDVGKQLEDDDDQLLIALRDLRSTLCQEYDVPAAPAYAY